MLSVANFCTDSVLSAVPKSVDGATQAFTTLIKPCVGFPQLRTVLFYFILFYFILFYFIFFSRTYVCVPSPTCKESPLAMV